MTVLLWILGILLVLLLIPVRISGHADPDGAEVWLRWLFVKVRLIPEAPEKEQKEPEPPAAPRPEEKKKKRALNWERLRPLAQDFFPRIGRPVRRLLRRTTIADVEVCLTVAGDDAAAAALAYGRINGVVYPLLAALDRTVTLRVRRVLITPDFTAQNWRYFFAGELRLIPLAALAAALGLAGAAGVSLLKTLVFAKKEPKPSKGAVIHGKQASNQ